MEGKIVSESLELVAMLGTSTEDEVTTILSHKERKDE